MKWQNLWYQINENQIHLRHKLLYTQTWVVLIKLLESQIDVFLKHLIGQILYFKYVIFGHKQERFDVSSQFDLDTEKFW